MKSILNEDKSELTFLTEDEHPILVVTTEHPGSFDTEQINVKVDRLDEGIVEVKSKVPVTLTYPCRSTTRRKRRSKYTRRKGKRKTHRS